MEWCYDWFSENYFVNSPKSNPLGPNQGWSKVLKGGSYENSKKDCELVERYNSSSETIKNYIGFRLAIPAVVKDKKVN